MLEILLEPLPIVQEAYGCLDEERLRAFSCRSSQDSEKEVRLVGERGRENSGPAADHWEEGEADSAGHTHLPKHVGING